MGDLYVHSEDGVTTISSTNYQDRIAEPEKEIKKLNDEIEKLNDELNRYKDLNLARKERIACLNGEIEGLKFAIRANGISGADVID